MTAAFLLLTAAATGAEPVLVPEIPATLLATNYPTQFFDLSPDGKTGVAGVKDERYRQYLRFIDVQTGAILTDVSLGTGELRMLTSARYSPDGKTVAVGVGPVAAPHAVRLIDVKTGKLVREFDGFEGSAFVRRFSADGKQLLIDHYSSSRSREYFHPRIETWDVASGKKLEATDKPAIEGIPDAVTPDGKVRVRRKDDGNYIVVREKTDLVTLATEKRSYHILRITPDGKRAVLASDERADVFDSETGELVRTLATDPQMITSAVGTPDGKLLFVAANTRHQNNTPFLGDSGWVQVWDLSKPALKTVISELGRDLYSVQPNADGSRFVAVSGSAGYASKLEVWDTGAKRRLHAFDVPKGRYGQAAVSPDGNWVALVSWEVDKPTLQVWNAETGKLAEEVTKAPGLVGSVAFTPDSKRLITVTYMDYAEWDLATGKKELAWDRGKDEKRPRFAAYARQITPLPGGKGVFTLGPTGNRRQSYLLGLRTEKKDWHLAEFDDFASSPVVSADGQWMTLVAGSHDEQRAFLLRLEADGSPELKDKPANHWGPVFEGNKVPAWRTWHIDRHSWIVSFAADGKRLYTGGSTHSLQVWDAETQQLQATLYVAPPAKPGATPTSWAIYTPAGHYAASAGGEQVLRFREVTESWFRPIRAPDTVPAADVPQLRNPVRVKAAIRVK